MEITLHAEAVRRFSELAEDVRASLGAAAPLPFSVPPEGSRAHVPIKNEIKLGVDTGDAPWVRSNVDPATGSYLRLEIHSPRFHLALPSSGIEVFNRLVDQVAEHRDLRELCSREYVASRLIGWLQQGQMGAPSLPWGGVLVDELRRDVGARRVLIPLEGIAIENEFSVGLVRFGFFTRDYFGRMYARMESRGASEQVLQIAQEKYQPYEGVVFAAFECVSEPQRAMERALEEVESVLALLRFFHGAALIVTAHCPLGRMGGLAPHQVHFFVERDGNVERIIHQVNRMGRDMDLSDPEIRQLMSEGLARVDLLLRATDKTDLQCRVLNAMALFSAGLLSAGIEHRLIHALVAVESLLLKSPDEPILASMVPRLAHVAGETVEERLGIVSDMRQVYKVRSSFVHHGVPPPAESIEMVNRAVAHCWVAVLKLLGETRWSTKAELIDSLEQRMLT